MMQYSKRFTNRVTRSVLEIRSSNKIGLRICQYGPSNPVSKSLVLDNQSVSETLWFTADVSQPWVDLHGCYFEYLIIRFDYFIIPFDNLIIG